MPDFADKSKLQVLVVDDSDIDLEMLSTVVSNCGYDVITATNGNEAWQKIKQGDIRLVITDWEMPDGDGLELCQRIRTNIHSGYVYVVLITSNNDQEDIVQGLSAGADDFIIKPFNPPELEARLRNGARILSLETRDVTIFAMAKLAESRDPETGSHLERVRDYCYEIASYLTENRKPRYLLDGSFARMLQITCPLHDVGKIGVPDTILLKPGRLSDDEFELMKTHTIIGGRTLEAALRQHPNTLFLQMARDIARYHHERWDGSGYPEGLRGETIPLSARIVTIADVYDALTSKRGYKDAFTHTVARSMIVDGSGSHFDPQLVEAFLGCEETLNSIRQSLSD